MSERGLLLDTCAALWSSEASQLRGDAPDRMNGAVENGALYVSPITAWEIGLLTKKNRIALHYDPQVWFERLLQAGAKLAPLTPAILIASSFLPEAHLRDPADRILAATAREQGWRLVTRDGPLLAYAEAGWMHALPC